MPVEKLAKLHTTLVDNRLGYEEAVKDTGSTSLKAVFAEMVALKERAHTDLHSALTGMGEKLDEDGSFMATVHTTMISIRSVVSGLDKNALMEEEEVVKLYDEAIHECWSHPAVVSTLNAQKESLLAKIAEMKAMET